MPGTSAPKARFSIVALVAALALIAPASLGASAAYADDPATGLISGHVTDAVTHDPIAGATVTLRSDSPPGGVEIEVETDEAGYYEGTIPVDGTWPSYYVTADGYGPQGDSLPARTAESPNAVVDVALPPKDAAAHGTVRDSATGEPIAGVDIYFAYLWGDESASTDSDGEFTLPNAVADAYLVRFTAAGYVTKRFDNVILTSGADILLDALLIAADATLEGRIVDGDGTGIPGLEIHATPVHATEPWLWTLTDADGYYTLEDLGAGSWDVGVAGPYSPDSNGDSWEQVERVVTFDAAETVTENFVLTEILFGSVEGHVYDTSDVPLDGICVVAVDSGGEEFAIGGMFGTDSSGYFGAQIPVGVQTLRFYDCSPRYGTAAKAITYLGDVTNRTHAETFELEEGELEDGLDVHLGVGGQISGTSQVRTPDGAAPLPGTRTVNVRPNLFQEIDGNWEPIPYENSFFGDNDGYIMFGLPPVDICVGFIDTSVGPNAFSPSFYHDADNCDDADLVTVPAGAAVTDVTALLSIPRPGDDPEAVEDFEAAAEGSIESSSQVTQGEQTTIDVGEGHAGEWMSAFGHSVPTLLGDWAQVSSDGKIKVTVPLSLPAGSHSLVVQSADGAVLGWNPVTVTAASTPAGGGTVGTPSGGSGAKTFGTTGATTHVYTLAEIIAKFGADTEEMLRLYLERTGKSVPDDLAALILGGDDELDLSDFDAWLRWLGGDTSVEAWSYSTPQYLGTFRVIDGQVVLSGVDLSALGVGEHHLVLVGQQSGTSVVASYEVPAAPAEADAEPEVTVDPPAAAEETPAVGADLGWLLWLVIAVGAGGVILVLVLMARRARTH